MFSLFFLLLFQMLKYLSPDLYPTELTANSAGHVITQIVVAETVVSHSGKYLSLIHI